ncbi:hypothetical protein M3Y95_01210500 [Aphelenchoides besseyi]|nr:hypothetical protein M3Y95_01210500 [Aphelenchoides besseyi]
MSSLANQRQSATLKWREFKGTMDQYYYHLYNDRFLPYIEDGNTLCILDLLHMKTKKFVMQWKKELITSRDYPNLKEQHLVIFDIILTDLHTVIIQLEASTDDERWIGGVVNNNLYGFWEEDWNKRDFSRLVRFCLETNEQTTLKVSGWPTDLRHDTSYFPHNAIWIGRTLVVTITSRSEEPTLFFVMNLDYSLHWRKLNFQFNLLVEGLFSNHENTLTVLTSLPRTVSEDIRRIFRFNFNRPDTLVNLSLYAIKQNSPVLQNAVDYLPNQFQCPFVEETRDNDLQPQSKRRRLEL